MKFKINIKDSKKLEQEASKLLKAKEKKEKPKKIEHVLVLPKEVKDLYRQFYNGLRNL